MNTGRLRLGMLSILLSVIAACMGVLSLLSFATSMADLRLANRYAETVRIRYELEKEGRALMSDMENGDTIKTKIEIDGYRLTIEADKNSDETDVHIWSIEKIWVEDTAMDHLWEGD